jgi:hypothetical protein
MKNEELVERLEKFPELKARFEELLRIAENPDGSIVLADDAEEMILLAGRKLTRETLQVWAENQSNTQSERFEQRHKNAHKEIKKNFTGTASLGK